MHVLFFYRAFVKVLQCNCFCCAKSSSIPLWSKDVTTSTTRQDHFLMAAAADRPSSLLENGSRTKKTSLRAQKALSCLPTNCADQEVTTSLQNQTCHSTMVYGEVTPQANQDELEVQLNFYNIPPPHYQGDPRAMVEKLL